jgi:hypothetical protein
MKEQHAAGSSDPVEEAVSGYLTYLKDPSSLIDKAKIRELAARLESSASPLEQLKIASELHHVESVDADSITAIFVQHAAAYAKRENLAAEAFLRLGVPRKIAEQAGLLGPAGEPPAKKKGSKTNTTSTVSNETKTRSPRTGREDVAAAIPARSFTYRDLEELSGASVVTVRRVVDDLLASGAIADIGVDPEYAGRGRAPRRFQPATATASVAKSATPKAAASTTAPARAAAPGAVKKTAAKKPAKKPSKKTMKRG